MLYFLRYFLESLSIDFKKNPFRLFFFLQELKENQGAVLLFSFGLEGDNLSWRHLRSHVRSFISSADAFFESLVSDLIGQLRRVIIACKDSKK